jgi:hypothetical protein
MRRFARLVSFSFVLMWTPSSKVQATGPTQPPVIQPAQAATTLPKADGTPLSVVSDISGSISVDAASHPASVAHRIFGKAISGHYAAVQMTISDHNPDAARTLQSALLDYSHCCLAMISELHSRRILGVIVVIPQPNTHSALSNSIEVICPLK